MGLTLLSQSLLALRERAINHHMTPVAPVPEAKIPHQVVEAARGVVISVLPVPTISIVRFYFRCCPCLQQETTSSIASVSGVNVVGNGIGIGIGSDIVGDPVHWTHKSDLPVRDSNPPRTTTPPLPRMDANGSIPDIPTTLRLVGGMRNRTIPKGNIKMGYGQ